MIPDSVSVAEEDFKDAAQFYKAAFAAIYESENRFLSANGFSHSVDAVDEAGDEVRLQLSNADDLQTVAKSLANGGQDTNGDGSIVVTDPYDVTWTMHDRGEHQRVKINP